MVLSIDLLSETREQAGVPKDNPYVFARNEGSSYIRGLDCFRRAANECGVKNPEVLLSSTLREQIASYWQLMSLSESELDQVAKLAGRSCHECRTLSENPLQLEEVSKQLLKMDRTLSSHPPSTTGDGTRSSSKKKAWSEDEQAAVKRYLGEFITLMKVPDPSKYTSASPIYTTQHYKYASSPCIFTTTHYKYTNGPYFQPTECSQFTNGPYIHTVECSNVTSGSYGTGGADKYTGVLCRTTGHFLCKDSQENQEVVE
ncbi:uncharacterized protein ACJ7VT_015153 [Polymixia lowei]